MNTTENERSEVRGQRSEESPGNSELDRARRRLAATQQSLEDARNALLHFEAQTSDPEVCTECMHSIARHFNGVMEIANRIIVKAAPETGQPVSAFQRFSISAFQPVRSWFLRYGTAQQWLVELAGVAAFGAIIFFILRYT
jgi:hypothetical protein